MAKQMIHTGEPLSADEALNRGLVRRLFNDNALMAAAIRLAKVIAAASPHSIAPGKALFSKMIDRQPDTGTLSIVNNLHATELLRNADARFLCQKIYLWGG